MPVYLWGMRVQFLKDVAIDVLTSQDGETDSVFYSRNEEIDVSEVVSVSKNFTELVLPSGNVLLDVKKDVFKVLV